MKSNSRSLLAVSLGALLLALSCLSAARAQDDAGTAAGSITINGGETGVLVGDNTYTGLTIISNGALTINNGTLSGSGTITVSGLNGTLSLGGSTLTGASNITVLSGGSLTLFNGSIASDPSDDLTFSLGTVTFGNGSALTLSSGEGQNGSGLLTASTSLGGYLSLDFISDTTGTSGLTGGDTQIYQNDIILDLVPEPGTWALMLGGIVALVVIQRRRARLS